LVGKKGEKRTSQHRSTTKEEEEVRLCCTDKGAKRGHRKGKIKINCLSLIYRERKTRVIKRILRDEELV